MHFESCQQMEITTTPGHGHPAIAAVCAIISFASTAFAWISLHDFQLGAAIGASIIASISGIFGAVSFYYNIKEKRINIKKLNQTP